MLIGEADRRVHLELALLRGRQVERSWVPWLDLITDDVGQLLDDRLLLIRLVERAAQRTDVSLRLLKPALGSAQLRVTWLQRHDDRARFPAALTQHDQSCFHLTNGQLKVLRHGTTPPTSLCR